jgi:hypothetical protein
VVLSRNLPAETEKPTKTLARLAGLWADFWTRNLPYTNSSA